MGTAKIAKKESFLSLILTQERGQGRKRYIALYPIKMLDGLSHAEHLNQTL